MSDKPTKPDTPQAERPPEAPDGAPKHASRAHRGGESNWARPVAQKRDRHFGAWLTLLSLICFAVAFGSHINRLYWRVKNYLAGGFKDLPRTSQCFLAISYEAVADTPDQEGHFISTVRFREHISTLRDAGYNPIGLEDVRAFCVEGRKLPEKAILVTFENTHKSTFFDASPVLREFRWRGVMGVVTRRVRENDPDSILAPYLRTMILDNSWELACESDSGTGFIDASSHGRTVPYLSAPMWIADENRPERPEEFAARVNEDHDRALGVFRDTLGMKPVAYFFPIGNYGQYEERNSVLRTINLSAVEERYDIGFLLGSHALNTAATDHRRLNRLRVPPEWTGATLLARLENEWPAQSSDNGGDSAVAPGRWTPDWGILETGEYTATLRALPAKNPMVTDADATGGARAWISGTDGFSEGSIDIRFMLLRGEFHVYFPFAADDDWLRVEIADTATAAVRHCAPDSDPRAIASSSISSIADFRAVHSLLITIRDGLLFVRLDNEPAFSGPVPLPETFTPGLIGAGVWYSSPGLAHTDILECHLRPRTDGLVTWAPALVNDPEYIARSLLRNAFRNTVISPPWIEAFASSPVSYPPFDVPAISVIAGASHARVMPSLIPHDVSSLSSIDHGEIVRQVVANGLDGVFLDAEAFPSEALPILKDWTTLLHSALSKNNLGLAMRFPTAVQNLAAVANFLAAMKDVLVVDENGQPPPGIPRKRTLAALHIDPPASDDDLTLFYQLSDYSGRSADAIPEVSLLRQQGLRAYSEGRYTTAIGFWRQWTESAPDNAEAWALLGNAFNRTRDLDAAIKAYGRSLDISPGQIDLALERARLLEQAGRDDECSKLLDVYARAFPDDNRIILAQAHWLDRHGRRSAGREILTELVRKNPRTSTRASPSSSCSTIRAPATPTCTTSCPSAPPARPDSSASATTSRPPNYSPARRPAYSSTSCVTPSPTRRRRP